MAVPILQKNCWIKITTILSCKTDFIEFQSIVDGSQFFLCTLEMFILIWCVHIIHIYIQITMDNYKKKFITLAPNK